MERTEFSHQFFQICQNAAIELQAEWERVDFEMLVSYLYGSKFDSEILSSMFWHWTV